MKMYITATFKSDENKADIEQLCAIVKAAGFEDFSFIRDIEKYQRGVFANAHELMQNAKAELLQCDALLIDVSNAPGGGGRTIEVGIAFGNGKKVIVIAKRGTLVSVPMSGVADAIIEYDSLEDIEEPLRQFRHK